MLEIDPVRSSVSHGPLSVAFKLWGIQAVLCTSALWASSVGVGWGGENMAVSLTCLPRNPLSHLPNLNFLYGLGAILHPLVFNTDLIHSLFFLIEGLLLYRTLQFRVTHQQEPALGTPVSPPSWTPLPAASPPHPAAGCRAPACVPWVTRHIPLAGCLTHGGGSSHASVSLHLPSPSSPPVVSMVCSLCLFLPCCPENKFIRAITSDPICMCQYTILTFLIMTYFTLIIGSSFIRLIRTDSGVFLFMAA